MMVEPSDTTGEGMSALMRRVSRSRTATIDEETSATTDQMVKPSSPGFTISSTPRKPTSTASQRRQPTCSSPLMAAMATTIREAACRMAVMLASGRWASAAMKVKAISASEPPRSSTGRESTSGRER